MFTPIFTDGLRSIVLGIIVVSLSLGQMNGQDRALDAFKDIKIYPNPSSEYFSISFSDVNKEFADGVKNITVDNIVGKEVKRYEATAENKYSLVGLKRGIYIVRIFDQQDRMVKALRLSKN